MVIERYRQTDESDIVELWNRCCTYDPINVQRFRQQTLLDENFNVSLSSVARENGRLIGFAYGSHRQFPYLERGLEPQRGWINVIFVDPDYRRRHIGSELYSRIEENLRKMGVAEITAAAYSPYYYFGGIDDEHYPAARVFFESEGFTAGERKFSMGKNLHGFSIPSDVVDLKEAAEREGFRFVPFDYQYCLELLDFLKWEFGGGWKRNGLLAMRNGTARSTILLALDQEDHLCGFCMRAIDGNPMRFGPIGVAERYRGHGLGTILLNLQCLEMAKAGIYRMFFMTTDEKARQYYERNGLTVIRTWVDYRKRLGKG